MERTTGAGPLGSAPTSRVDPCDVSGATREPGPLADRVACALSNDLLQPFALAPGIIRIGDREHFRLDLRPQRRPASSADRTQEPASEPAADTDRLTSSASAVPAPVQTFCDRLADRLLYAVTRHAADAASPSETRGAPRVVLLVHALELDPDPVVVRDAAMAALGPDDVLVVASVARAASDGRLVPPVATTAPPRQWTPPELLAFLEDGDVQPAFGGMLPDTNWMVMLALR